MTIQTYLVVMKNNDDDQDRERVAEYISSRSGFTLMVTSRGSLIVAFDDGHLEAVRKHHLIKFVGGVTLFDSKSPYAIELRRLFARNVALQLASRGNATR